MNQNAILIPHINIQNANALSSPFTIGFPAMTAWMGAVHALQRKINAKGIAVKFTGVGVVSHDFDLQTYQGSGDFVHSIIGTGNPLEPKTDKNKPKGNAVRPSFIEEARCHLEASLVIEYTRIEAHLENQLLEQVAHMLCANMKLAGGDILGFEKPEIVRDFDKLKYKLMPGYALIERRDLMAEAMQQGQDAMDAMLDYLAIHHTCERVENAQGEQTVGWQSQRKATSLEGDSGWIVPIATGFHGISELGQALNQRDPETPHCFAEAVVTLGEFKMPYRLNEPNELLWHYHTDEQNHLYLCQQTQADLAANDDY